MRNFTLISFAFVSVLFAQAECRFGIVIDTTRKNNNDPQITKIVRNDDGKIVYKEIYNKDGILSGVDSFYYSGNYQLDSIIGFNTLGQKTPFYTINEWTDGKLTRQFRAIDDGQYKKDTSVFTYDPNTGKLKTFSSSVLSLSDISYNSSGNIGSAKIEVVLYNNRILVDALITFDDKPGSFRELGLNDDVFSYFNVNNLVSVAPVTSPNSKVVDITYTYNSFGVVKTASRFELIENTTLNASYSTDCVTSLQDIRGKSSPSIFPNPSNTGTLTVDKLDGSTVEIYSTTGEKVAESNDKTLNISRLNKGMYFVRFNSVENVFKTEKLIVE